MDTYFQANLNKLQEAATGVVPNAVAALRPIVEDAEAVASEDFGIFSGDLHASQGVEFFAAKDCLTQGLRALLASIESCGVALQEVHDRYLAAEQATIHQLGQI